MSAAQINRSRERASSPGLWPAGSSAPARAKCPPSPLKGESQLSRVYVKIIINHVLGGYMTNWKPEFSPQNLYFITTSSHQHSTIFKDNVTKQIILDIFDCYRRQKYIMLYSFVIMPTHIHFIAKFSNQVSLADFMRNIKSLSADRIHRYHNAIKRGSPHSKLQQNSLSSNYKIWEDDYITKEIYSFSFLEQKIDYIHQNPCRFPWKISNYPEEYPWSSACFYLSDFPCIIPIDDIREILV